MTFNELTKDSNCNCLSQAFEDTAATYARKLGKSNLRINDFRSKWENGDNKHTICEKVCGKKGLSINKIEKEEDRELIIENYSTIFTVSPSYKPHVLFFKFETDAGLIKKKYSESAINHHNFYKCDEFNLTKIVAQEIVSLEDYA